MDSDLQEYPIKLNYLEVKRELSQNLILKKNEKYVFEIVAPFLQCILRMNLKKLFTFKIISNS